MTIGDNIKACKKTVKFRAEFPGIHTHTHTSLSLILAVSVKQSTAGVISTLKVIPFSFIFCKTLD